MNADGSALTPLTQPGFDFEPSWSPNGQQIAFTRWIAGEFALAEIYVMAADGSALTQLTNEPGFDGEPSWSPDGQRFAFVSTRDGNREIYVMNADGSAQTRLTNNPADDVGPKWSPDGRQIAFTSLRDGNSEVYVMAADGSAPAPLTNHPAPDAEPSWSPDGQQIVFRSHRDGNAEIYVMGADGSAPIRLTNHPAADRQPSWSPNGLIAFTSDRDGNSEIYAMGADGSAPTRLTNRTSSDFAPSWWPWLDQTPPHSQHPGTVHDLAVTHTTATSATLSFTEVDDGNGQPASYDVRYAYTPIGWGWGSATKVTQGTCSTPVAGTAIGARRTCTVEGLASSTRYDFQLVAFRGTLDQDATFGGLSNVATGRTPWLTSSGPPGTVSDLAVTGTTEASATLSFTEVDDGTGQPARYDVRYAHTPIGWGWGSATKVTQGTCSTPVAGSAIGAVRTCTVEGLAPSTSYDFQLVAFRGTLDQDATFGGLSNVATGRTPSLTSSGRSGTVSDLAVTGTTETSATLSFTDVRGWRPTMNASAGTADKTPSPAGRSRASP